MPNDNNVPFERWAIFNNTSPLNEYKNILLNVTLPNVQAEELNKIIFVDDGIIDTPEIELIEDLAICRYHLKCQKTFLHNRYIGVLIVLIGIWEMKMIHLAFLAI